ncbi:MAG TPA: universal stress protein [Gaiellaceae bacterium]|nr:universal stress protein [Gaiellaceae bacterium]
MKPVMLATDGSPTAAEATATAIELARLLDTELVIVSAWDIPYAALGFGGALPTNGELAKLSEEQARRVNAEAAARAEEADVETRSVVLRGFPVEEICIAVETFDPRFLVVGSHGWGPVRRALFGSVSTGVLHHAACPVLVVRGDHPEKDATREDERATSPA